MDEMKEKCVCYVCGAEIGEDDAGYEDRDGNVYCEDCEDARRFCDRCGEYFPPDEDLTAVHTGSRIEEFWCEHCTENYAICCDDCNEYYDEDHIHSDDNGNHVCDRCYSDHWYTCADCGDLVHADYVYWGDNEEPYCCECINSHSSCIHDYGYEPILHFYHATGEVSDGLYLGFELEAGGADCDGDVNDCANDVENNRCYCKHDGSIPDYGFELVSHPHTLRAHQEYDWERALNTMRDCGLKSHDIDNCGLHVHVSRKFMCDACWTALDMFLDDNRGKVIRFARRHSTKWARFRSDADGDDVCNRYRALNFCNSRTREFRLFKGTLKYSTFMATLELVDAMCRVANAANGGVPRWSDLCGYLHDNVELYSECIAYMQAKHIWEEPVRALTVVRPKAVPVLPVAIACRQDNN